MKYKIRVSDIRYRLNYSSFEVENLVKKFLLSSNINSKINNLLMLNFFRNKSFVKSSVSFIHNRCVVTFRDVLYTDYLNCLGIS